MTVDGKSCCLGVVEQFRSNGADDQTPIAGSLREDLVYPVATRYMLCCSRCRQRSQLVLSSAILVLLNDALLLQASTEYISCAGLNYGDFMSLVHADMELLQGAAKCFATKVEEMEVGFTLFALIQELHGFPSAASGASLFASGRVCQPLAAGD